MVRVSSRRRTCYFSRCRACTVSSLRYVRTHVGFGGNKIKNNSNNNIIQYWTCVHSVWSPPFWRVYVTVVIIILEGGGELA